MLAILSIDSYNWVIFYYDLMLVLAASEFQSRWCACLWKVIPIICICTDFVFQSANFLQLSQELFPLFVSHTWYPRQYLPHLAYCSLFKKALSHYWFSVLLPTKSAGQTVMPLNSPDMILSMETTCLEYPPIVSVQAWVPVQKAPWGSKTDVQNAKTVPSNKRHSVSLC